MALCQVGGVVVADPDLTRGVFPSERLLGQINRYRLRAFHEGRAALRITKYELLNRFMELQPCDF